MMKRFVLGAAALLASAGTAVAAPIVLPNGPIAVQFNNIEQIDTSGANSINCALLGLVCTGGTTGNWGILKVSSMQLGFVNTDHELISGGGSLFFADQTVVGGGQVTGVFYDIDLLNACPAGTPPPPAGPSTCATGGVLDLYWNDLGVNVVGPPSTFAPTAGTVTTFTTGTFLARLNFATGIQNNNITTVTSDINLIGNVSGQGTANSFSNVDLTKVGAWTNQLNTDYFFVDTDNDGLKGEVGETRDVRFRNTFNLATGNVPTWDSGAFIKGFTSTDPATTDIGVVPEPATLTLLGLGLLGSSLRRRKKA